MNKFFVEPEMNLEFFAVEDIITSTGSFVPGENETEGGGGL